MHSQASSASLAIIPQTLSLFFNHVILSSSTT